MRVFLVGLFCFVAFHCLAIDYYFSSSTGRDWNEGTISKPFQTLKKISSLNLYPGDRILLKGNEYFYGGITTRSNGSYKNKIVITSYGNSSPAIINGTTTLTKWEHISGGIYASEVFYPQSNVKNVIIDDKQIEQGRYPNTDSKGGFLIYQSYTNDSTTSTIYSNSLNNISYKNYVGAELKVKSYLATQDGGTITGFKYSNGALFGSFTFNNTNMFYPLGYNNCGFYVTNSIYTLDQFGEWYYNPNDRRLYVYFGNSSPATHRVEASSIDVLLDYRNASYELKNVVLRGANRYGVKGVAVGIKDLNLNKVQILKTGIIGIAMANCTKIVVDNCTVTDIGTTGINIGYNCDSPYITNSVVNNAGLLMANLYCDSLFQKRMGYGVFMGRCKTKGLYMYNTDITNTAYSGLAFTGSNNFIYCNYITNALAKLDDGGAIYYTGWPTYVSNNNIVRRNILYNAPGNYDGFPINYPIANLFFADDYASNITVDSNVFYKSGKACLTIHNGRNCYISKNILACADLTLFHAQDDNMGPRVDSNTVVSNYFYNLYLPLQDYLYWLVSTGNATDNNISKFGSFNYNYLIAPNVSTVKTVHTDTFNIAGFTDYLHSTFVNTFGYDKNSKLVDVTNREVKLLYAIHTDSTFNIPGTWINVEGNKTYIDKITLKHHTGILLIKVPVT